MNEPGNNFIKNLLPNNLEVPAQSYALDLLGEYIEHLWSTGEGRGKASDTLEAIQDLQPHSRGTLPLSWRLLRTWHVNEIPSRAPPLPEKCLQAMIGWSIAKGSMALPYPLWWGTMGCYGQASSWMSWLSMSVLSPTRTPP